MLTNNHRPTLQNSAISLQPIPYNLAFAQAKLLNSRIPLQLKAISYVRICCHAIRAYQRLGLHNITVHGVNTSYLNLLRALTQVHTEWWDQCVISHSGYLVSSNSTIRSLLEPLNTCVAELLLDRVA